MWFNKSFCVIDLREWLWGEFWNVHLLVADWLTECKMPPRLFTYKYLSLFIPRWPVAVDSTLKSNYQLTTEWTAPLWTRVVTQSVLNTESSAVTSTSVFCAKRSEHRIYPCTVNKQRVSRQRSEHRIYCCAVNRGCAVLKRVLVFSTKNLKQMAGFAGSCCSETDDLLDW